MTDEEAAAILGVGPGVQGPGGPTTVRSAPQIEGPSRIPSMLWNAAAGGIENFLSPLSHLGVPVPQGYTLPQTGLLPQNAFERYATAAARGAGGAAVPAAIALGAATLPASVPLVGGTSLMAGPAMLAAGTTGGLATQGGLDLGLPSPAAEGFGTVAGLATGGALNFPYASMTPAAARFAEAGVPMRSLAYTSGSPVTRASLSGVAPKAVTEQDLGNAVERIAAAHGTSRTPDEAGQNLVTAAKDWRGPQIDPQTGVNTSGMAQEIDAAAAPMNALIPNQAVLNHDELANRFGSLLSSGLTSNVDAANSALRYLSRAGSQGKQLSDDIRSFSTGLGQVPVGTWATGRLARTNIGNMLATTRDPAERAALRYLYGGSVEDLGQVAATHGALDEFNNFNAVSTAAHNFNDGPIEDILSADRPAQVFDRVMAHANRGPSEFAELQGRLPSAMNEMTAAHLRQIGLAQSQELGSPISPSFATKWQNLSGTGSSGTLIGNPDLLNAASAVADIQRGLKPQSLPSPTRTALAGLGTAAGVAAGYLMGHGNTEEQIRNMIALGGEGMGVGAVVPYATRLARSLAANNRPLAVLSSRQWSPLGMGLAGFEGSIPPFSQELPGDQVQR